MIGADNSQIADPIMRAVVEASPSIGVPIIAMDNNEVQFVKEMPAGRTAPARIGGITQTTVPCVLFTHQPVSRPDPTLAGTAPMAEGFADFIVVAPRNGFTNPANAIAAQIAALFPKAARIAMTGGQITIIRPATPLPGYGDGPHWRVPVRVSYRAA